MGKIKILYNVLRLGGRFNAAKPLLWAVAVYFKPQLGLMVSYDYGFVVLDLPFVKIMLNVTKHAKGTNF